MAYLTLAPSYLFFYIYGCFLKNFSLLWQQINKIHVYIFRLREMNSDLQRADLIGPFIFRPDPKFQNITQQTIRNSNPVLKMGPELRANTHSTWYRALLAHTTLRRVAVSHVRALRSGYVLELGLGLFS